MNKKKQLKIKYPIKTNFMPKLSLWLIVIVAIILFDKFVDVMGLNKDYLIRIVMNINENDENQDLQREKLLPFEGFMVDIYRLYLAPLEQTPMGASLVRGLLYCTFVSCKITECSPPPLISRGSSVVQLYYHMFLGY